MADPFSVVAGIVGVAAASAHLANKIHDFTDKVKNAPTQMHDVAFEMSQLSSIFRLLATVLEDGRGAYDPEVLTDADSICHRVKGLQDEITKLMRKNKGDRGRIGIPSRIKWVLSYGRVAELLDRIEAAKSSLSLLLDTTQLAVASREPRSSDQEIERLKQMITAGVKEIRQCVIGLQTAKPALMFESPKMLTEGPSSRTPGSRAYPWLSLLPAVPPAPTEMSKRRGLPESGDSVQAIEPSSSQFETASWLYSMTMAPAKDAEEDPIFVEEYEDEPLPEQALGGPRDLFSRRTPEAPSSMRRNPQAGGMQVVKAPPPHQLYELSISAIAQKLIKKWTYLDPGIILPEETANGSDLDAAADSPDEDEGNDQPFPEPLRRRFTFQEYDRELESGDIHNNPQHPQRKHEEDDYGEDLWSHRDFYNSAPRGNDSKVREQFKPRPSAYLSPEPRFESDLHRDKRSARPAPNVTIYNTTRTEDERDATFRPSRVSRRSSPGPASRMRGRPSEWILEDEVEDLRRQIGLDRSEYEDKFKLFSAEQRLRDAEAKLEAERRVEETERRGEMLRRELELKYIKERQEREEEEERIKRQEERLLMDWELKREREERARELVQREAEESRRKTAQEKAHTDAKFERLEQLIIAQQQARLAKDEAKKQGEAEAALQAVAARKRADDDKLARLEELILEQKADQLRREADAAAQQAAEREANDATVRKIVEEKEAATEMARRLQEVAQKVREETEDQKARELAQERELRMKAEEMALALRQSPPSESGNDSVFTDDLRSASSTLVDLIYGEDPEIRWYQTAKGPRRVDVSDGYFARKILEDIQQKPCSFPESVDGYYPIDGKQHEQEFSDPGTDLVSNLGKYHLVFSTSANGNSPECKSMTASLRSQGLELLFEIDPGRTISKMSCGKASSASPTSALRDECLERNSNDTFVDSSLLWQKLPRHGQSELYLSLCRIGWRPTYLRTSEKGQTWFFGKRPVYVRFNQPDYAPCFTDFENDTEHTCVLIGTDVVGEDALRLTGIEYQPSRGGCWKLEPTITYDDIASLVATSFSLREMSLRSLARKAFSNPEATGVLNNGIANSHAPAVPALKTFGHPSEASLGAQEGNEEGLGGTA